MKVDLALLDRIQELISSGATGSPECMAKRLGLSKRHLHNHIKFLKTEFNAPIAYSRSRETFYYTRAWEFYMGDLTPIRAKLIKKFLMDSFSL